MYEYFVKRGLDIILSTVGLVVLFPAFIIVGIVIKVDSPGPVIFTQERVGLDKQPFQIYKFRTMYVAAPPDAPTWKLDDVDSYITEVGKFIRRTSIDELPQLYNVLKGDMSLIGPRPVIWGEEELIEERYKRGVYNVLPGLTGLAQISGRDYVRVPDKARIDQAYAENLTFKQDLEIFTYTIWYVLKSEGISEGMQERIDENYLDLEYKEKVGKERMKKIPGEEGERV